MVLIYNLRMSLPARRQASVLRCELSLMSIPVSWRMELRIEPICSRGKYLWMLWIKPCKRKVNRCTR
jgi:hypothetical protein